MKKMYILERPSVMNVCIFLQVTLIFYAVCITLNAYHRQPAFSNMSPCVRGFVMQKLGRLWGMDDINNEIQQKLESLQEIANLAKSEYRNSEETRTLDGSVNRSRSRFCDGQHDVEDTGLQVNEFERENINIRSTDSRSESFSSTEVPQTFKERQDFSGSAQPQTPYEKHKPSNSKLSVNIEESSCTERQSAVLDDSKNARPGLPVQSAHRQKFQALHYCECESCKTKPTRTRCSSFLNEMIALNQRLISNIQEINYLARNWDYKTSQKEHWLIAASILDKAFFILFVVMFVVLTLCNFI